MLCVAWAHNSISIVLLPTQLVLVSRYVGNYDKLASQMKANLSLSASSGRLPHPADCSQLARVLCFRWRLSFSLA